MAARMTIAALNDVLGVELDAINQYFVPAKVASTGDTSVSRSVSGRTRSRR